MRLKRRSKKIKKNIIDRSIDYLFPVHALKRMKARAVMAFSNNYHGASKSRRSLSEWSTSAGDADTDISGDLPVLRERSRDLIRNNSLATGAINTKVTHVVGAGLRLQSRVDAEMLGLLPEKAALLEKQIENEWKIFADSKECDIARTNNFCELQNLAFRSVLENGDCFVLTPTKAIKSNPYQLKLQLVEADSICNADGVADTDFLCAGIEKDKNGAPEKYHIATSHPGQTSNIGQKWKKIPAFGAKTGRRNVLHLYHKKRIGQSRGVPDLAPVIEDLKQLSRYTDAVLTNVVISAYFTVFIKSEFSSGLDSMEPTAEVGGKSSDKDFKMGPGAMLDLQPNEDVSFANPAHPNSTFDPFVLAMSRQIGVALELPFELLVKHFTASYSAARGALLEAWQFFMTQRTWLVDNLCNPVFELFFEEAVLLGRITAPGFIAGDIAIKQAYLGAEWVGPSKGQIDEKKEIEAAAKRVELGVSTISEETAALTGGDWEQKHKQRVKEINQRRADGLEPGLIEEVKNEEEMVSDNE